MALASVTREEFKIRSELEVLHIPTGAVFQAYPYSNPMRAKTASTLRITREFSDRLLSLS